MRVSWPFYHSIVCLTRVWQPLLTLFCDMRKPSSLPSKLGKPRWRITTCLYKHTFCLNSAKIMFIQTRTSARKRGLPNLDGKLEHFVTKKVGKRLPNSSQTDYNTLFHDAGPLTSTPNREKESEHNLITLEVSLQNDHVNGVMLVKMACKYSDKRQNRPKKSYSVFFHENFFFFF